MPFIPDEQLGSDSSFVPDEPVVEQSMLTPEGVQSDVAGLALAEQQAGIPQVQDELSLGQVGRMAVENFVPSAKQFGGDIFKAVSSPKQTAKAFSSLISGTAQLLVPGEQGNEDVARAFGDFIGGRYGSVEALKQTIATDPVGFAADLSTFVTGLGAVAGVAGKAGTLSKISQIKRAADVVVKAGRATRRVGAAIDPIGAIGETARQVSKARGPINSLAKTALNIKADLPVRTVDRIAQEFMDRGLNVNRSSLAKLDKQNAKLNRTIHSTIGGGVGGGKPFKAEKIIKVIDELKDNAAREGLSATDLKHLDNLKEDFGLINGKTFTGSELQDMKVGFNKAYSETLTDQFGAVRAKFFDKARIGTKTELERIWPEIKQMNLDEGAGIELRGLINKSINSVEKSPTIRNLGLAVGGIGGSLIGVGASPLEGLGFAFSSAIIGNMLSNPANGVKMARIINKSRKAAQGASLATRPAFQSGRAERVTQQPLELELQNNR